LNDEFKIWLNDDFKRRLNDYFKRWLNDDFKLWFNIRINYDSMIVPKDYVDKVMILNFDFYFRRRFRWSQVMILNDHAMLVFNDPSYEDVKRSCFIFQDHVMMLLYYDSYSWFQVKIMYGSQLSSNVECNSPVIIKSWIQWYWNDDIKKTSNNWK
jgi:hypothetical protein